MAIGRMAIILTVTTWVAYICFTIFQQFVEGRASSARLVVEAIVYMLVVTALTASAMAYLVTRIGFFYRTRAHRRSPRAAIDESFQDAIPTVTVLVPSYQEDERVIRTTLLSAALQEHPYLRIVLLIDDPPSPTKPAAQEMLDAARLLPERLQAELEVPVRRFTEALDRFEQAQIGDREPTVGDLRDLAAHYDFAVTWLRDLGERQEIVDHADTFFVEHVLGALAGDLSVIATALREGAEAGGSLSTDRLLQLHRRLVATFRAEISSFERKRYVSLSSAPNKAMNLNSYIGLMGGSYREVSTPLGLALEPCAPRQADLFVPDPDYVLTLDADSVLLPEYCVRILYLMEQSAHAKVGVAQTPYSAFPGSATRIERIAGATTDLQHLLHQGLTHYGATFWVGANAILRKRALDDIMEIEYEGDWEVRRYIQDRTVIEDTESTIDLGIHGWTLLNYPERLAYSATPPDFGSLCIQRQRWANGGLLILSKVRQLGRARRARGEANRFGEIFLRVNYMASIFWSSICLLVMLCYPFNDGLLNPILLLIALPYFVMMASDLRVCGYKRSDILRIYGFNLILLPVNLSGTFASVLQLITGEKSAFKRTPKVRDRTTARALFILAPCALIGFATWTAVLDVSRHRWENLAYAGTNAALAAYAMVAFVGLGNSVVDLWVHLRSWLYRPVAATPAPAGATNAARVAHAPSATNDWSSVLHFDAPPSDGAGTLGGPGASTHAGPWGNAAPRSGSFDEYVFFTVFQPIVELVTGDAVGYEALTRFADGRSPQDALDAARAEGLDADLDAALVRAALTAARGLPPGVWLSVNVSPGLAQRPADLEAILADGPSAVVVEVAETLVDELSDTQHRLPAGTIVAIDDAGAGYDTLARIERLRPAYMKLNRGSISGIEHDGARRAFVRMLVEFAREHGCQVIAEGIETEAERDALRDAGVDLGQGYYLGRPVPVDRTNEAVLRTAP